MLPQTCLPAGSDTKAQSHSFLSYLVPSWQYLNFEIAVINAIKNPINIDRVFYYKDIFLRSLCRSSCCD